MREATPGHTHREVLALDIAGRNVYHVQADGLHPGPNTSQSIPVLNTKVETALDDAQQATLKSAPPGACAITDLPARLSDGQKTAVQLEPLPALEALLGNTSAP